MLQVIEGAEEGEDSLLQRIKKEPGEAEEGYEESSTLQIRVNASAPRKVHGEQSEVSECLAVFRTCTIQSNRLFLSVVFSQW